MKRFKIVKKFSLDFIGEGWEKTYINFEALTISDVRDKFPQLSKIEEANKTDIKFGLDLILNLLKEKFVEGKGISEDGKECDLAKEDLEALPVETLSKALSFLSQGVTQNSPKPSEIS